MRMLLKQDADVNAVQDDVTPLHSLLEAADDRCFSDDGVKCFELLAEARADLFTRDSFGDAATIMLPDKMYNNCSTLSDEVVERLSAICMVLVNCHATLTIPNRRGLTYAHLTIELACDDLLSAYLAQSGEVNAYASDEGTPLHMALTKVVTTTGVWIRRAENNGTWQAILQRLINAGANVNVVDSNGRTPLLRVIGASEAPLSMRELTVAILLDSGADINFIGAVDASLHLAARMSEPVLMRLLLERGASVNVINAHNQQPLHCLFVKPERVWNTESGIDCFQMFAEAGADFGAENAEGKTPATLLLDSILQVIHISTPRSDVPTLANVSRTCSALIRYNICLTRPSARGVTCGHLAIRLDNIALLRTYTMQGGDLDTLGTDCGRPLNLALGINCQNDTLMELIRLGAHIDASVNELKSPYEVLMSKDALGKSLPSRLNKTMLYCRLLWNRSSTATSMHVRTAHQRIIPIDSASESYREQIPTNAL